MNQRYLVFIIFLLMSLGWGGVQAAPLLKPAAPAKIFVPLLLNSLYPFELLDKSVVKYLPPRSDDSQYVFVGALRNVGKRVVYGSQFTASFYKQNTRIHQMTLKPMFEAHFPNQINYFRGDISAAVAEADRIEIALEAYHDVHLRTFAALNVVSSSPPPAIPPRDGQYNYLWVLRNPNPYPLINVFGVADTSAGYVSVNIGEIAANETLTRTFTTHLRPYTLLAAQGHTEPMHLTNYE
ncbi:MAG: hypothetical protein KIH69_007070 [Anaerolineae bacterium]|nr:hypothetical protein [Anaerolineae bacterium]